MSVMPFGELTPPFYLCRWDRVAQRRREIEDAFRPWFPELRLAYSYKTNSLPYLLRRLDAAGVDAEVVSSLEYRLARRLGVEPARIVFNGPGKSAAALAAALAEGALVNLDGAEEVDAVLAWARAGLSREAAVGLRVNVRHPEGEGHRAYSRFGLPPEALADAARRLRGAGLPPRCLHVHLSTRSRDAAVFRGLAASLAAAVRAVGDDDLRELDLGGGLGWAPPELPAMSFPSFAAVAAAVHGELAGVLDGRRLVLEPGIALVGGAFSYVAPVLALKQIGGRSLALVDGSVHTVKPTRHRHNLPTVVLDAGGRPKQGPRRRYDVVGYTCMDDDYLAVDQELPELAVGDLLRIDGVGAYTLVFKPPFIRAMPPVYAEEDGGWALVRREETLEDLLRGDVAQP